MAWHRDRGDGTFLLVTDADDTTALPDDLNQEVMVGVYRGADDYEQIDAGYHVLRDYLAEFREESPQG